MTRPHFYAQIVFRTEVHRRTAHRILVNSEGRYEVRGNSSIFEHPESLNARFTSMPYIPLGDRYLIRSAIEGFANQPRGGTFYYLSELHCSIQTLNFKCIIQVQIVLSLRYQIKRIGESYYTHV